MSDEHFGTDPPDWKTLTPAQQSALTWLLVQRVHAARNRAIGKTLLAAVGEVREQLCTFTRLRPSARRRKLAPAGAARKGFLNMSLSSLECQRASAWRHAWRAIRAIRSAWTRYCRHQQLRRDLMQLAAMDDRSLRDIGISRTEIRAAIREGTDLGARRR